MICRVGGPLLGARGQVKQEIASWPLECRHLVQWQNSRGRGVLERGMVMVPVMVWQAQERDRVVGGIVVVVVVVLGLWIGSVNYVFLGLVF